MARSDSFVVRSLMSVVAGLWLACAARADVVVSEPSDWTFYANGSEKGVSVTVPHDWAIYSAPIRNADGTFDDDGRCGGLTWRGTGRYEATFRRTDTNSTVYLSFGGVMSEPRVYVNGDFAGGWDYGYMSFALDVTQLATAAVNRLTVLCDTRNRWSRWYPGAGIYRPVRVVEKPPLHVLPDTMRITTPVVTSARAVVAVACETSQGPTNFTFEVRNPRLWDVDDPHLHDFTFLGERFRYGIRTFQWTADDGFHLNGRRVQIKGTNLHSDLGPLGMEFHVEAARRQLLLMKDMGVNALRTSHNPPARELLDLCDELGIVVWDECYDGWRQTADNPVGAPWSESLKRNLRAFVARDRNHPSVVAWSLGNEINVIEPGAHESYRRQLTAQRVKELADFVRGLDGTRPVAMGCHPGYQRGVDLGVWDSLDLVGWNYWQSYLKMREKLPKMPLVISESASAVSSAGYYELPLRNEKYAYNTNTVECTGYDLQSGGTLDVPDVEFFRVERDRYLAGEFVWTGIDYLGEPTPFWGPARSSYFGAADLCGFPKDRFYLYRSHWNDKSETVHLVPGHWNFKAGETVPVFAYVSGDEAELFLNGRSLGRRQKRTDGAGDTTPRQSKTDERILERYRLMWKDVVYEPGELRVVAFRKGEKIGEEMLRTAGAPVRVRVTKDPFSPPGRLDFYRVELVDARGTPVPGRSDRIRFSLQGPGRILAVGNGNAHGTDSFRETSSHPLFNGRLLVIVRRDGEEPCTLQAVPGT